MPLDGGTASEVKGRAAGAWALAEGARGMGAGCTDPTVAQGMAQLSSAIEQLTDALTTLADALAQS